MRRLVNNETLSSFLRKEEEKKIKAKQVEIEAEKHIKEKEEGFEFRIKEAESHE